MEREIGRWGAGFGAVVSPSNRRQVVAWSSTGLTQSGAFRAPAKNNQNFVRAIVKETKRLILDFQNNIDGISGPIDPHNRAAQAKTDKELVCVQTDLPPSVIRGFPVNFLMLRLLLQPARGKCLPTWSWAATRPRPPESVVDWPWVAGVLLPLFSHRSCTATGIGC